MVELLMQVSRFFAPSMADSTHNGIAVGKDFNSFRCVTQTYHWAGGNQNSGSYYDISHMTWSTVGYRR